MRWRVLQCFYDDENNNFRSKLYAISGKVRQNIVPHVVSNIKDEISPVKLEDIKMKPNITHIIQCCCCICAHSLRQKKNNKNKFEVIYSRAYTAIRMIHIITNMALC